MELPFVTLDVFTETRFRGNPLAVVTIPASGPKPTQEQKQAIAREFNLSETVFVHDVPDPDSNKSRSLDIFLPSAEIPFAGHPIIGAAVSLLDRGVSTLLTKAGPVALEQTGPRLVQASIPHRLRLHARRLRHLDLAPYQLPADPQIRDLDLDAPVFSIVNGVSFVLTELPSLELLARVEQSSTPLPVDKLLDDGWQEGFLGRMIEHTFEDPATGAAACCLAAFLSTVKDEQKTPSRSYEITQGVEMAKESSILVHVAVQDSHIHQVKLAGTAVQVMRGHITV